ncbi:hypothetical protein GQ42DRAFT_162582 [Ramicandelaber brevisporus]|nr:hypothetical protein GQ42DRAFT_162582 [Ramicandelaber brevisporus]
MQTVEKAVPACLNSRDFRYMSWEDNEFSYEHALVRSCNCSLKDINKSFLTDSQRRRNQQEQQQQQQQPVKQMSLQITHVTRPELAASEIFKRYDPGTIVHLNLNTHYYYQITAAKIPDIAATIARASLPNLRHCSVFTAWCTAKWQELVDAILVHAPKLITLRYNYSKLTLKNVIRILAAGLNLVDLELLTWLNENETNALVGYIASATTAESGSYCPCHLIEADDAAHDDTTCKLRHGPRPMTRLRWLTIVHLQSVWKQRTIRDLRRSLPSRTLLRLAERYSTLFTWYSTGMEINPYVKFEYFDNDFRPNQRATCVTPDTSKVEHDIPKPKYPLNVTYSGKMRSSYKKRPSGTKHQKAIEYEDDDVDDDDDDIDDNGNVQ